jgi:acetate---CoA ligase (ADP-forming)
LPVARAEHESAAAVDVILRDGSTLRLRAPTEDDVDALVAFFSALSERSLYLRFHGVRRIDRALVEHFVDPDWQERGVLVGVLADEAGAERIVAAAEFMRLHDESSAEVAFTVADELQGRGIGTRLLEQLAVRAAGARIESFVAEVLSENARMLSVFRGAGFDVVRELEGGEIEVRFPIASTEAFRARVDERDHLAVTASLRPFFAPRSLVVVGASRRRGSIGGELFRNVLAADFEGAAYPVNRDGEPVGGVRAYRSIKELPEAVDLAVICLPGGHVLGAAEAALAKGITALCVISSGFAEVGAEGLERQERLLELVRAHGGRLVGPNCLGIAIPPPPSGRARCRPARSPSRLKAARSVLRSWRKQRSGGSGSPPSSRSGTRQTSRRTTCSNGGRTTRTRSSCSCTWSRLAIRPSSAGSPAAWRGGSRSWR